jgi:hypothetical protein
MSLLTGPQVTATPIEKGDAGIILKKDGTFQLFNTGDINPDAPLSAFQEEMGMKLIALSIPLVHEPVMKMLLEMANDPLIVGEKVIDFGTPQ